MAARFSPFSMSVLQNEDTDDLSQEGAAAATEGPITAQPTSSQDNRSYGSIDVAAPHPSAAAETGYQVSS